MALYVIARRPSGVSLAAARAWRVREKELTSNPAEVFVDDRTGTLMRWIGTVTYQPEYESAFTARPLSKVTDSDIITVLSVAHRYCAAMPDISLPEWRTVRFTNGTSSPGVRIARRLDSYREKLSRVVEIPDTVPAEWSTLLESTN